MSKLKTTRLISTWGAVSLTVLCLVLLCQWAVVALSPVSPTSAIQLSTKPNIENIKPFEAEATSPQQPVELNLQAMSSQGQPIQNASMHLQILTPQRNIWLPTDFPVVEGTPLLDIKAIAPEGKVQIQQLLPIRGTYQLIVDTQPLTKGQFEPFQRNLSLTIPENEVKYRNFGILIAVLAVVGFGGGVVIGSRQLSRLGEIAPQPVRQILSGLTILAIAALLYINISAELSKGHHHEEATNKQEQLQPQTKSVPAFELQWLGDRQATVGQLANLGFRVIDTRTKKPLADQLVNIKTTQLEDGWLAFAFQSKTNSEGQITWRQQFFDGAPHKIEAFLVQGDKLNSLTTQEIEVEPVAPPLLSRLIVLGYLTGTVVLGLLAGLAIRRPRQLRAELSNS